MKKISRKFEYAHSNKDKRIRRVGTYRKVPLVGSLLPGGNFRKGNFIIFGSLDSQLGNPKR